MLSTTLMLVLCGLFAMGMSAGVIGCFTFLRKRTLIGDAVAHAVLPGVAIGYMFSGTKDPISLLIGGVVFGYIAIKSIDYIANKTKLSEDTAIALVTTVYFAFGSTLLSYIAGDGSGQQAGLKDFLFGKAATLTEQDVILFICVALIVIFFVSLFFRPFVLVSFNKEFAASKGWKVKTFETILAILTVMVITIGLQAVGVVLMSALLIAPAASARYWTDSLKKMMVLSAIFGACAGVSGALLSLVGENMPTGPWVIMVLFLFTMLTLLFAPKKGYVSIRRKVKQNERQIHEENVLKTLHQLSEEDKNSVKVTDLLQKRKIPSKKLDFALDNLIKKDFVSETEDYFELSETGKKEAIRVVRLHRLWELYLTQRMNFKEDHIHGTAETIEHLITEELEESLLKELDYPTEDPHSKQIPY